MNGAEYDTLRRSLGLSVEEAAWVHDVNVRQIRRWARDDTPIPADVIARIEGLRGLMEEMVDHAVDQVTDAMERGPIILWRYPDQASYEASPDKAGLPLGAHAMMVGWAADALRAEGVEVDVRWFTPLHAPTWGEIASC